MTSQQDQAAETQAERVLRFMREHRRPIRAADLEKAGASRTAIARLVSSGEIVWSGRGVYRLADAEFDEREAWAAVARQYPTAVINLLSAASFHGMTQDGAWRVSIGVPHSLGTTPRGWLGVELDVVRWRSQDAFEVGIEEHEIMGVPVRVTSPTRTLVDLFRMSTLNRSYRQVATRITPETFLDALFRYFDPDKGLADVGELARTAGTFKVMDEIEPYVQTAQFRVNSFGGP